MLKKLSSTIWFNRSLIHLKQVMLPNHSFQVKKKADLSLQGLYVFTCLVLTSSPTRYPTVSVSNQRDSKRSPLPNNSNRLPHNNILEELKFHGVLYFDGQLLYQTITFPYALATSWVVGHSWGRLQVVAVVNRGFRDTASKSDTSIFIYNPNGKICISPFIC